MDGGPRVRTDIEALPHLLWSAEGSLIHRVCVLALSSGSGGATTILVFTAAVALVWAWPAAVSVKPYHGVEVA